MIKIIDAEKNDAPLIACGIMDAVGLNICQNMAGSRHSLEDVNGIFCRLAERDDSQYSYLNSRIAIDEDGNKMGVCISYDGATLKRLRRSFFNEANRVLGWVMTDDEIEALPGETIPEEFYLDTLMVLPDHRNKGVGQALIKDAYERARKKGKPLGLLVEPENHNARRLYERMGFRQIDKRPFAGVDMNHLQLRYFSSAHAVK